MIDTEAGGSDRVVGFMQDRQRCVERVRREMEGLQGLEAVLKVVDLEFLPCARAWT